MKEMIIDYLTKLGYHSFQWEYGRNGFFLLARWGDMGLMCFDLQKLVNEMLDKELEKGVDYEPIL